MRARAWTAALGAGLAAGFFGTGAAAAAAPEGRAGLRPPAGWVALGLGPAGGPGGAGLTGAGRAGLLGARWGAEVGIREGVLGGPTRTVGTVFAGATRRVGEHATLRAGFSHHHETPWETFVGAPVGALAGTAPGIAHRSGVELGGGWARPLPGLPALSVGADLGVSVMPGPGGPPVTGFAELTVRGWLWGGPAGARPRGQATAARPAGAGEEGGVTGETLVSPVL